LLSIDIEETLKKIEEEKSKDLDMLAENYAK